MIEAMLDLGTANDLLSRYVTFLDERRFDEWLALFTDDCRYTMILHNDFERGNNMVSIGENKPELAGRIEVGQNVERDRTTHMLSAVATDGAVVRANFAVIRKGTITVWGRYAIELVALEGELKIRRCTAVLNNEVLNETQYLPV